VALERRFPPWDITAKHRLTAPLSEMKNRAVRIFGEFTTGMPPPATTKPLPAKRFSLSVPLRSHRMRHSTATGI